MRWTTCCTWAALGFFPVSAIGATINLFVDPSFGSTSNTGSTATIRLDFFESGAEEWMSVTLENTTPPAIGSKLTAVGFELPESLALSVSFAPEGKGSYFDTLTYDHSVTPGWLDAPGGYDLMITSDGNFSGGTAKGAPSEGVSHVVTLTLGDTGLSPEQLAATFSDYYVGLETNYVAARFQAVGPGGEKSDKVVGRVPEPATVGLVALGMLLTTRRRRPMRRV